eukprot:1607643-Rhodomonas_salina.2
MLPRLSGTRSTSMLPWLSGTRSESTSTCGLDVANVSTQGRHPLTTLYPHVAVHPETKHLLVEDAGHHAFNLKPGRRYQGPRWTAKCEKGYAGEGVAKYNGAWLEGQWVSK